MRPSICLITGATSGIGRATAFKLAASGWTVIIVGRDHNRLATTAKNIIEVTGNSSIDYFTADLSSQKDIYNLAKQFCNRYSKLDALINNAATLAWTRQLSPDGIDLTFALNHLGYFLLTNLLLDVLVATAPSRVINVSSVAHRKAKINLEDIQRPKRYNGFRAYSQSKLANLLFTYELARRVQNTRLTVNAVHPGIVATNLPANARVPMGWLSRPLLRAGLAMIGQSAEKASKQICYLVESEDVSDITGKYFVDGIETISSKESYDAIMAHSLWILSTELTGFKT